MKRPAGKSGRKRLSPPAAFALECLASAALGLLPAAMEGLPLGALTPLLAAYQFTLVPLCALGLPALAGARGVPPLAAFFPPGILYALALPLLGLRPHGGVALAALGLGIVGACAGQEYRRRAAKGRR